jgi:glycosyltransferase involved in cell wall biosynthesis
MKIAIEAQRIFRANKHGMDFVILEALKRIREIDKENEYFIFTAGGEDVCLNSTDNMHIITLKCPSYPLWEQYALPMAVNKLKPDLLHCTSNTAPILCKVPLVITLHDIIFLEKRESSSQSTYQNLGRLYRRLVVPKILPKCKKIITVSNFECKRIKEFLNLPSSKITAIYNGYDTHFKPIQESFSVTSKFIEDKKYLFFLGNTDPKKNTQRVLEAYSLYLKRSTEKLPLLIADLKEEFANSIIEKNNLQEIKSFLHFCGYICNRDLVYIYNGAKVFLYPSLRESFGIPILEGMACGTPVITSNTSAMPEIAGDGAILINPTDPLSITEALLKLENDTAYYNSQVAYGLERVKLFSWEHTANSMLQIYKEVAGEQPPQ